MFTRKLFFKFQISNKLQVHENQNLLISLSTNIREKRCVERNTHNCYTNVLQFLEMQKYSYQLTAASKCCLLQFTNQVSSTTDSVAQLVIPAIYTPNKQPHFMCPCITAVSFWRLEAQLSIVLPWHYYILLLC